MRWLKFTATGQTSWGIVEGDRAVALTRYQLRGPKGDFTSDVAETFGVANGKINSFGIYFDTAPHGIELVEPRLSIPAYVWAEAPTGVPIEWRAIARMPRARFVVARGCLVRSG